MASEFYHIRTSIYSSILIVLLVVPCRVTESFEGDEIREREAVARNEEVNDGCGDAKRGFATGNAHRSK